MKTHYNIGDCVVYHDKRVDVKPSKNAKKIKPSYRGETYTFIVDKFWKVCRIKGNKIHLVSRKGKLHIKKLTDAKLEKAGLITKLLNYNKFNFSHIYE